VKNSLNDEKVKDNIELAGMPTQEEPVDNIEISEVD